MIIAVTGLNRGQNPQPGHAVIRSIRRVFGQTHRIAGLVYDPLESGVYADDGPDVSYTLPYPSAGREAFLQRLDAIRREEPLDALIPCLDSELELLLRMTEDLKQRSIRTCLPGREAFEARHKHRLSALAKKCGVRTPLTFAVSDAGEMGAAIAALSFPVMVKGRYYGAKRAADESQLHRLFLESIQNWGGPVLIQQIIQGEEYNVAGLCGEAGRITGAAALKKTVISAEGKGFGGVTVEDPALYQMAGNIMKELAWTGPFELEVMREPSGDYSMIEINPRFPAWIDFPSMIGANLPAALVDCLEGKFEFRNSDFEIKYPPSGKMFLRHNIELCCDLRDVGALSATGKYTRPTS